MFFVGGFMKKYVKGLALVVFFVSCSMQTEFYPFSNDQTLVKVINWNLQTFFDSKTEGTEYDDYRGSKTKWDEQQYINRLKTLCTIIEKTQADVYVFQEIENSAILQDIGNELAASRIRYDYSCFSKTPEDALGLAILSRYPLQDISVHNLDFRVALGLSEFETSMYAGDGVPLEQPSMRPLLHAQVVVSEEKNFSLYVCHWKSKFGGAEKSEIWRNAQEMLLVDVLSKATNPFLIAGDFNRTLEEFLLSETMPIKKGNSFLLQGLKESIEVFSPWLEYKNSLAKEGSYYYQGHWEKIDHFFYSPLLEVIGFQIIANELTVKEEGLPFRYELYTGKGVSDHLPLQCIVEL